MVSQSCEQTNSTFKWGVLDLLKWKLIPDRFGGGIPYIQKFKDAWVKENKRAIKIVATQYKMPHELLAGVCWIEVAGDPHSKGEYDKAIEHYEVSLQIFEKTLGDNHPKTQAVANNLSASKSVAEISDKNK